MATKDKTLPTVVRTRLIMALEPDTLYTAADIAKRHPDAEADEQFRERLRCNIYKMGCRRGELQSFPDNAKRNPKTGMPLKVESASGKRWRVVLESGQHNAWYGRTWQEHLTPAEIEAYRQAVETNDPLLHAGAAAPSADPDETLLSTEERPTELHTLRHRRNRRRLLAVALSTVVLTAVLLLSHRAPSEDASVADLAQKFYQVPTLSQGEWTDQEIEYVVTMMRTAGAAQVVQYAAQREADLYKVGLKVLQQSGVNEALFWFKELAAETEDPVYLLGMARVHWSVKNIESVRSICQKVLTLKPSDLLRARALYTLANAEEYSNDLKAARESYKSCLDIYELLKLDGGRYVTATALAAICIKEKDLVSGNNYLTLSRDINKQLEKPYPVAFIDELEGEIAFEKSEYSIALKWYQKSHQSYLKEGDIVNGCNVKVKIGICQAITGDYTQSTETAKQVDETSLNNNLLNTFYFNKLVWMYIARCKGNKNKATRIEDEFKVYSIKEAPDSSLFDAFAFMKACPCSLDRN